MEIDVRCPKCGYEWTEEIDEDESQEMRWEEDEP
jgi:hypothetical protein